MFTDTINKCAANAARIARLSANNPLGFWVSSAMAGAYVGLGIILIFTLGNLLDPSVRPLVMGATFGIALTLVIIAGSELFTGHTMFLTLGVKAGTISHGQMWAILPQTGSATGRFRLCRPALQLGRRQFVAGRYQHRSLSRAGENHRARHGTVLQRRAV